MPQTLKAAGVQATSQLLYRIFAVIAHRRLRRQFRAVRLLHEERLGQVRRMQPARNWLSHRQGRLQPTPEPLILYFNHASWWDPLVCIAVQRALLPRRRHYAPMDAVALKSYEFFRSIGVFPVDVDTPRGAAQFMRGTQAILANGGVLWVSPQGEFVDVRKRPVVLKPGLGALLHRLDSATVIPVAMEYTFWDQRLPEALVSFGEPITVQNGRATPADVWTERLTASLTVVEDELAELAMTRDAAHFRSLLVGGRGTAGIYGVWQRLRARMRGERFSADHQARHADVDRPVYRHDGVGEQSHVGADSQS